MSAASRARALWRSLFRRAELDRELEEELRSYEDLLADQNARAGMSPECARRDARVAIGSLESVKQQVAEARLGSCVFDVGRDVRLAARSLARSPGLLTVVVATLALGVGANTALFSVARAVLLEPLPYPSPERLVIVWSDLDKAGYRRAPLSGPELADLREGTRSFEDFAGIWTTSAQLTGEGEPEQVRLGMVTANFLPMLGAQPVLGRGFEPADEWRRDPVPVVLGHAFWRRRFGGDPAVIGRAIRMNGRGAEVVGVLPPGLELLFPPDANVPREPMAFVPMSAPLRARPRAQYFIRTIARLRPGLSLADAEREMEAFGAKLLAAHADYAESGRRFHAVPLHEDGVRDVRPALLALLGGVGLLLLIAAMNVSNLLVARALRRRRETAVRSALGATALRLARECLAQGLLLATLGGAAGIAVALGGLAALLRVRPEGLARVDAARLDGHVLVFTAAIAAGAGILCSLLPLREVLRGDLHGLLESGRQPGALGMGVRGGLLTVQVALGFVLLVGAGLLARTLALAERVDPGFRAEGVLTFRVALPAARYPSAEAVNAFSRALEQRLRALPGVESVGAISHVPLDESPNWSSPYRTETGEPREADARAASPGFFAASGATLVAGRSFEESDDTGGRPVVIVDESLAGRTWPGTSALGRRLNVQFVTRSFDFVPTDATVVGVVRHLRHRDVTREVREQVYIPFRQAPRDPMAYFLRTGAEPSGLAAGVRAAVARLDPDLPVYDLRPLADYTARALAPRRFVLMLSGLFAGVALLLAAIGSYGVVAYSVGQRGQEFGIRRALGAGSADLLRLVMGETTTRLGGGLLAGAALAFVLTPRLEALLYGVAPRDPLTWLAAALVQVLAVAFASVVPARRAAWAAPLDALRVL